MCGIYSQEEYNVVESLLWEKEWLYSYCHYCYWIHLRVQPELHVGMTTIGRLVSIAS